MKPEDKIKRQEGEIRNDRAAIKDFVHTKKPLEAQREIFNFMEAANFVMTVRQAKIFWSLIVHYKNLCNTKSNFKLMKSQDEVYRLKLKAGEKV